MFAVVETTKIVVSASCVLISCILHAAACSGNRCAVQMIDSALASSGAPQSGPRERKSVGGLVGFSRNRVAVDPGCECCLALSYLSTVILLARLLKVTHTVGTRMCYHADSRSFFSLHNIPHGQPQLQSQPQALRPTQRCITNRDQGASEPPPIRSSH